MKVLLINPRPDRFTNRQIAPTSPLGLLAVASYIKAGGHTVKIVDLTVKSESIGKTPSRLLAGCCRVVGDVRAGKQIGDKDFKDREEAS